MKKLNRVQKQFAAKVEVETLNRGHQKVTVFNSLKEIVFQEHYSFPTKKEAESVMKIYEGAIVFIGWKPFANSLGASLTLEFNRDDLFDTESIATIRSYENLKENLDNNVADLLEEIELREKHDELQK